MTFQPFVIPLLAVDDSAAGLHPDALGERTAQASSLQGAFGAAEKVGHALFGNFVDVTLAFGIHRGSSAAGGGRLVSGGNVCDNEPTG